MTVSIISLSIMTLSIIIKAAEIHDQVNNFVRALELMLLITIGVRITILSKSNLAFPVHLSKSAPIILLKLATSHSLSPLNSHHHPRKHFCVETQLTT